MQICNSVVKVCRNSLELYTTDDFNHQDQFWIMVSEAIHFEAEHSSETTDNKNHPLVAKLNSFLQLGSTLKELLYHIRDVLLPQMYTNLTGTNTHASSLGRNASIHSTSSSTVAKKLSTHKRHQSLLSNSSASDSNNVPSTLLGIPLQNVDRITSQMNDFGGRVLRVLEIVSTLAQFEQMNVERKLESLPRISGLWNLNIPQDEDGEGESSSRNEGSRKDSYEMLPELQQDKVDAKSGIGSSSDITLATPDFLEQLMSKQPHHSGPLTTVKEESLASNSLISSKVQTPKAGTGILSLHACSICVSMNITLYLYTCT